MSQRLKTPLSLQYYTAIKQQSHERVFIQAVHSTIEENKMIKKKEKFVAQKIPQRVDIYINRGTPTVREEDLLIWNDILFLTNTFSMKKIITVSSSSDMTIAYRERIEDMRKSVIVSFIRVEKR